MEAKAASEDANMGAIGESEIEAGHEESKGMGSEAEVDLEDDSEKGLQRPLSAVDRQYAANQDLPRRIHIIGTGSVGKLVAHSLRGIANPPPITLIFHRYGLLKAWEESRKEITIQDDEYKVPRGGFDVELAPEHLRQHGVDIRKDQPEVYDVGDELKPHKAAEVIKQTASENEPPQKEEDVDYAPSAVRNPRPRAGDYAISHDPIHNLIVTTKAPLTISALSAIRDRISSSTTICFLQNGMGIVDSVNEKLFPHPRERPNYIQGIVSHGVNVPPEVAKRDPFFAVHAGHGTIALGLLPRNDKPSTSTSSPATRTTEEWPSSARHLLRTLTRTPVLGAVGFTPLELLQLQLEKLAVNSVLNPLTTLLDARNGSLLSNFALTRTMRLLLAETSLIIRSLPELQGVPNANTRFSAQRLETLTVGVANKTAQNISSMLADVRAGKRTEIEYINGWIVRKGEEVGVKAVVNYAIMQTVMGKAMITQREVREEVPFERRAL